MNKQSKKVELCVIQHASAKNNRAYLLRTEITKNHLNNHIWQHRGMKTSTVTPSFYYVFNISLNCNDTIPSFIGNLWRVLLLGNHLKEVTRVRITDLRQLRSVAKAFIPSTISALYFPLLLIILVIFLEECWLSIIINLFLALIFRRWIVIWCCTTSEY